MKLFSYTLGFALALGSFALPDSAFAVRESGGRRAPLAIAVDFNSVGAGIDSKALKRVLEITQIGLTRNDVTLVTNKGRGREGERTVCVEFANWQAMEPYKKAFAQAAGKGSGLTAMTLALTCEEYTRGEN